MPMLTIADFALRLGVGAGCGALIGLERQWRARMAGLRTNALVATGATLFVLYAAATDDSSPTRVASYVVSGIGFLGGGVILREGFNVRGLNTAATLWCSAAVGVLAASGHLAFALIATAAVVAIHLLGRPLGRLIDHDNSGEEDEGLEPYQLQVICRPKSAQFARAQIVQHTSSNDSPMIALLRPTACAVPTMRIESPRLHLLSRWIPANSLRNRERSSRRLSPNLPEQKMPIEAPLATHVD